MRYQNYQTNLRDQHLYAEDDFEIMVIQHFDNGEVQYNVTLDGVTRAGISHEQVILCYWDNDDTKPHQKTLRIALDMGVDLMEKQEDRYNK